MARSAPRTKIAALGTLAALGALAAVATASNPAGPKHAPAPGPVAAVRQAPPKTVVVHRTVGVLTKFVPARGSATPAAGHTSAPATHKAAAVATPAAAAPSTHKASPEPKAQPTSSADSESADLPEPGVTENECLPVTTGGAPEGTTAGAPATVAMASASRADRRAARRAARRARRRAERRARRRAHRRATKTVRGGRPLRTSHPLPEDAPGGVVDGCGLAPVPGEGDAASTPAPAADASTVVVP